MARPAGSIRASSADQVIAHEFVQVKGGLIFPVAAVALALELSMRGIPLVVDPDLELVMPTDPRLTVEDRAAIARWRRHLAAIVLYECPTDEGWPR